MKQSFRESFDFTGGSVTGSAENPVVTGVLLCGPISQNKRRYLTKAFEGDRVKRYNGAAVNLNHGRDERTGRPYQEQIGVIQNARHRADGMPIGDIAVNPKKPYAEAFLWDAKNLPKACSMSHVAECDYTTAADGYLDVIEILKVESVDVISANNAATTNGLFESVNQTKRRKMPYLTVKQLAESLVKHPKVKSGSVAVLKRLAEMDGMDMAQTGLETAPADDAEPGEPVQDAFKTAIAHLVDQATCFGGKKTDEEVLKSIRELMKSHGKLSGTGAGKDNGAKDDADNPDDEGDTAEEARKRADLPFQVLRECQDAGYNAGPSVLKALIVMSPDERKSFIEEHRLVGQGQKPVGSTRRPPAGRVEPTTQNAFVAESAKLPEWK